MATKKRRADEDDEEDEDRPRKKRKPAKEEDDEDDEEPPPPKKNKESKAGKVKKTKGKEEEEDEGDGEEDPYEVWMQKQKAKRQQLLDGAAALKIFANRAKLHLICCGLTAAGTGAFFGVGMLVSPDLGVYCLALNALGSLGMTFGVPSLGILGDQACGRGPTKVAKEGVLMMDMVVNITIIALLVGSGVIGYLFKDFLILVVAAYFLSWVIYHLSFILELIYLRTYGLFLKDKVLSDAALGGVIHFILVVYAGPIVFGFASYFLNFMGMLGWAIAGVLWLVLILLYLKGFKDIGVMVEKACLGLHKKVQRLDKPEW